MKCVILAAGYATRLYPLTANFPKPLLDVGGKPILDWLVDDIAGSVDEFIVVTNHRFYDHFSNWASSKPYKITVLDDGTQSNETRLGAVCDIRLAIDRYNLDDDLFIMAGDNLLDFSLGTFLSYCLEKETTCVMRYAEPSVEKLKKCGVLEIDSSDRVVSMEEKPQQPRSQWCCPPFYYLQRRDVSLVHRAIADGCGIDAPGSLVVYLTAHTLVHAMQMPGCRFDVGNLESYETLKNQYDARKKC